MSAQPNDELVGKTFKECAEIIVGNPKDKEWTDRQIKQLCIVHDKELSTTLQAISHHGAIPIKTLEQWVEDGVPSND